MNDGENHADRRSQQQPADTEPKDVAGIFNARHAAAKIEGTEMVEARVHFRLLRQRVDFNLEFPAIALQMSWT